MGCGEKRGDWGPIWGHRQCSCPICPTSFMEPAHGEAGGGGGGQLPAGRQLQCPPLPVHMQPCMLHPAAVRTGRRKAESSASAHFTLLPAACAPRFAALCHAASIAWSSPGFPSAASQRPGAPQEEAGRVVQLSPQRHPSPHRAPRAEARGAAPGVPPRFPQLLLPI